MQQQQISVDQALQNLSILLDRVDAKRPEIITWERSLMALAEAVKEAQATKADDTKKEPAVK